ncbi:MAG TPA: protein kinase [Aggregatilineaceae bacterium]|nr:protein kinase [Aggregatilineaceae bacterium]
MESIHPIKGYEIHERIGSGRFGVVHKAYQTTFGREVAIKIILPYYANDPDFIRRFEMEAQLISRLEHPYIVPLYDYWRDADGAFLVMRWLRGGNLRDSLTNFSFDLESTALFLDQITSALGIAHRNSIVHQNLKPSNILLDENGNVYLSDFGIAKNTALATRTDIVLGSPDYLSPEQVRSDPVTPQTDIYSLGVMLYEVLTGKTPFTNILSTECSYKHLNEPIPFIETLPSKVAKGINAIIQKATVKDPAHRYSDVLEIAADFRRAADIARRSTENIVEQLTLREQEILAMIVNGCSNKEIAQHLFVTIATIKWHIRQVYQKLHVRSRVQAIVRARELNLIVAKPSANISASESTYIALPEPENPYKGLHAFQMADARDFFGRERLVQRLIKRMSERDKFARFVAVVGPSGSGKSSVVKAGLVPALWNNALPGSDRWFVAEICPGAHPLDELEIALTWISTNQSENLREQLERDARGLVRIAGLILPNDDCELVIIIDQFEELFTLVNDEAERTRFLGLLYCAVTDPCSRVRVVITLRADFYDRPLFYPEFGELVCSRMETVLPLSADELEAAITKPAERVGVSFESGLIATIISDLHYQPGGLPLLQYALTELFEQRSDHTLTQEAYVALGGAAGALTRRAEELYQEQEETGRENIRQMFLRLVSLVESAEDTRRRVRRSELLSIAGNEELMDEAIDTYADFRLLTLDHDHASRCPTVEIAHEAILREWERLRDWLNESRYDILQQRLLAAAMAGWRDSGKDPSYLLSGARLEQFAGWAGKKHLALTLDERKFLDTSITERKHRESAEQERQQRELETQRRATNRLRYLVVGLIIFLIAVFALSLFAFGKQREAEDARETSDVNAALALQNAAEAQDIALVSGARAALAENDIDSALALAVTANRVESPSNSAQLILSKMAYQAGPTPLGTSHPTLIWNVQSSSDGRYFVAWADDGLNVWDAVTFAPLFHTGTGHTLFAISPNSRMVLGSPRYSTSGLILWDLQTGNEIRRFTSPDLLSQGWVPVAFSPNGSTFFSSNGGNGDDKGSSSPAGRVFTQSWLANAPGYPVIFQWDVATGQVLRRLEGHRHAILGLAVSPDGHRLLSGGAFGEMILWDLDTGDILHHWEGYGNDYWIGAYSLEFTPDGRSAATTSIFCQSGFVATLWNLGTYEPIRTFDVNPTGICMIDISSDGYYLMANGHDGARLWDIQSGSQILFIPSTVTLMSAIFGPTEETAVIGRGDGSIRIWNLHSAGEIRNFETEHNTVYDVMALSPDDRTLYVWEDLPSETDYDAADCWLTSLDIATEQILRRIGPMRTIYPDWSSCDIWFTLAISPQGNLAATGGNALILWDLDSGQIVHTLTGHNGVVTGVSFSPDGRTLLSCGLDGQVLLWDVATGQEIRRFVGHDSFIGSVDFSPDGRTAISSSQNQLAILWDINTGEVLWQLEQGNSGTAAFSPDGRTILLDNILLEATTGIPIRTFASGRGNAVPTTFSPDGQSVFGMGGEGDTSIVFQWDVATGELIREYPGLWYSFVLSSDGSSLFARHVYNTSNVPPLRGITQYRIETEDELLARALERRYVRELTCTERSMYRLETGCDSESVFPTRTPYPTLQPIIPSLPPSPTVAPATTTTPTIPPHSMLVAHLGEQPGEVKIGNVQIWTYEGRAGEILTIRVNADNPVNGSTDRRPGMLDTLVVVTAPNGMDLNVGDSLVFVSYDPATSNDIQEGVNTNSLIEGLVLPEDGMYQIEVSGYRYQTGGPYTLVIESQPGMVIIPTP